MRRFSRKRPEGGTTRREVHGECHLARVEDARRRAGHPCRPRGRRGDPGNGGRVRGFPEPQLLHHLPLYGALLRAVEEFQARRRVVCGMPSRPAGDECDLGHPLLHGYTGRASPGRSPGWHLSAERMPRDTPAGRGVYLQREDSVRSLGPYERPPAREAAPMHELPLADRAGRTHRGDRRNLLPMPFQGRR